MPINLQKTASRIGRIANFQFAMLIEGLHGQVAAASLIDCQFGTPTEREDKYTYVVRE